MTKLPMNGHNKVTVKKVAPPVCNEFYGCCPRKAAYWIYVAVQAMTAGAFKPMVLRQLALISVPKVWLLPDNTTPIFFLTSEHVGGLQ